MLLKKPKGPSSRLFEPGNYAAVCIQFVDMGTHYSDRYDKDQRLVRITWNIPELAFEYEDESGSKKTGSAVFGKTYNAPTHGALGEKSNLRKDLESWRGRAFTPEELDGFDSKNIIGKPCLLNLIEWTKDDGSKINVVNGITPLPKGMAAPTSTEQTVHYDLNEGKGSKFDMLYEWQQQKIEACKEWNEDRKANQKKPAAPEQADLNTDDDVPF